MRVLPSLAFKFDNSYINTEAQYDVTDVVVQCTPQVTFREVRRPQAAPRPATPDMPVRPSPRSVEATLAHYRANPNEREALAARVAGYAVEEQKGTRTSLKVDASLPARSSLHASKSSDLPSSPSRSAHSPSPSSPTLGTHKSWSALDTSLEFAGDDPVGGWKEVGAKQSKAVSGERMLRRIAPYKMETVVEQPPLKFGFESEGARRRQYAARTTTALLGPQEAPLGSSFQNRDTESTSTLVHSPLPRTLRPTARLDRGIHASAAQPHAMSHWQPANREVAWKECKLHPAPLGVPTPKPMPPNADESAARAHARAARSSGSPRTGWREAPDSLRQRVLQLSTAVERGAQVPAKLSERAMRQLRDTAGPISGAGLRHLVGADQPGAHVVRELVDLDKYLLRPRAMASERSVLSTPSRRVRM